MSIEKTLEAYNYLRAEDHKPQLKSWNKSAAELAKRAINEYSAEQWGDALKETADEPTGPQKYNKVDKQSGSKAKREAGKSAKKTAKKATKKEGTKRPGIGAFILEQDQKLSTAEILALVLKQFPGCTATAGSVSSVRSRAKK